jgi:PAS domain S-box-containing protein
MEQDEIRCISQVAIDNAPEGILWFYATGEAFYANKSFCRRSGYGRNELAGMTYDP